MFYAIEYAYGAQVVNGGQRADRIMEFTARRLRDAWVAAGHTDSTASGYREVLHARDKRVRSAYGLPDGDGEAWRAIADARMRQSAALARHSATIDADWSETDHYRWVATAPEREIVRWAEAIEAEAVYVR